MKCNFVIIIPTYNAKTTIEKSILAILNLLPEAKIIIVDDNSPDGTGTLVSLLCKRDTRITLLSRNEKSGRGSAVIAGLKEGLRDSTNMFFIEMDADMCHDPKYIPQMILTCQGADVVIASRYLSTSKIYGWTLKRKVMSFAMNHYAHLLLGIPIHDYTDGFRCYSRNAVEVICNYKIRSRGYIVLSEIAYLCYKRGMVFAEIPIEFYFNSVDKSNLNIGEVKEALSTILKLRFTFK